MGRDAVPPDREGRVVGGEPLGVVLANNGRVPLGASAEGATTTLENHPGRKGLARLRIEKAESGEVAWVVQYGVR